MVLFLLMTYFTTLISLMMTQRKLQSVQNAQEYATAFFLPVVSASWLSTYLFQNDSFQTEIIAFVAFSFAQSALLYTTMNGQRRIRINTLSLSCTTALSNLFRGADLDTQFTYLLKNGMDMYSMLFIISSFNCFLVVTCWDNIHMCMQPCWGPYVIASIVLVI